MVGFCIYIHHQMIQAKSMQKYYMMQPKTIQNLLYMVYGLLAWWIECSNGWWIDCSIESSIDCTQIIDCQSIAWVIGGLIPRYCIKWNITGVVPGSLFNVQYWGLAGIIDIFSWAKAAALSLSSLEFEMLSSSKSPARGYKYLSARANTARARALLNTRLYALEYTDAGTLFKCCEKISPHMNPNIAHDSNMTPDMTPRHDHSMTSNTIPNMTPKTFACPTPALNAPAFFVVLFVVQSCCPVSSRILYWSCVFFVVESHCATLLCSLVVEPLSCSLSVSLNMYCLCWFAISPNSYLNQVSLHLQQLLWRFFKT